MSFGVAVIEREALVRRFVAYLAEVGARISGGAFLCIELAGANRVLRRLVAFRVLLLPLNNAGLLAITIQRRAGTLLRRELVLVLGAVFGGTRRLLGEVTRLFLLRSERPVGKDAAH
jgi:hypothetical protein